MSNKRFRIAFSFAGEKRDFVAPVAELLAQRFGQDQVLYDKFHEAEFSRPRLGRYLPKLYHDESDLVVLVLCKDYQSKEWCGLEWDAIFALLKQRREADVMLCRFDHATVAGLYSDEGFSELDAKSHQETATLILQRLALNEGKPRDFYSELASPRPIAISFRKQDNPFQTAGALPQDHRTYIQRAADAGFAGLLAGPDRLISITGEFGIGKSSLMQQARRILPSHEFFGGGLADLNSTDESRFMRNFFKLFARRFGAIADWDELDEHIRQSPSVLFLDDLSEVAAPGLGAIIPAVVERFAKPGNGLHVITTKPKTLKEILGKRDLANPKYSRPWKNVLVGPLEAPGARQLLEMLPPRSQALAFGCFPAVEEHTQLRPQPLQCLCHRLYDSECDALSDAALTALIQDPASYE